MAPEYFARPFRIAQEGQDPTGGVPAEAGVDIEWTHRGNQGNVDLAKSKAKAQEMVESSDGH